MPDRDRILTAIHGFTLALIAIAIAGAATWATDGSVGGGLVGAITGALVATVVGLLWRSADERAAERQAQELQSQVDRQGAALSDPNRPARDADRLAVQRRYGPTGTSRGDR